MVRRRRCVLFAACLLVLYLTCMRVLYDKTMKGQAEQSGPGRNGSAEASTGTKLVAEGGLEAKFTDSTIEGQLPAAFQAALKNYSIVPLADVKIVFIVTYYRAGSTFLGELVSSGPRTYFHFEPLMLFTVSGRIRSGRERHAFQLIEQLLRCRMESIPLYTAWLENHPYYKFNRFLAEICKEGHSCTSPSHMSAVCLRARAQVFKFTRLHVSQVAAWLQRNSEIARLVRVLHLVRDPRGIYHSRRGLKWCMQNAECDKASALCMQMRADLEEFRELTRLLPPNRTHTLRFEDLALDPVNETKRLYARLGLDYTSSVAEYLKNHTTATRQDMKNAHGTKRNTRDVPGMWKKKLSRTTVGAIEETCIDVMRTLGYEFLVHSGAERELKKPAVSQQVRISGAEKKTN
ncbi:carbohydrate sulfotransferase 5-like [Amblyomma americanum]